jgi:hypothetical protein
MRRFGKSSYQLLALAMQTAHGTEQISGTAETMWKDTIMHLARMLKNDSPYFQIERFTIACQPGAPVSELLRGGPHL